MRVHMFVSSIPALYGLPAVGIVTAPSWIMAYARLRKDDPLWRDAKYVMSASLRKPRDTFIVYVPNEGTRMPKRLAPLMRALCDVHTPGGEPGEMPAWVSRRGAAGRRARMLKRAAPAAEGWW